MTTRDEAMSAMDAFTAAFAAGDVEALRSVYADDAMVWQSSTGASASKDQSLAVLGWIVGVTSSRSYQDVRRLFDDGRLVEQHTVVMVTHGGTEIRVPACLLVQVEAGRITRIEEYIDPSAFAALSA